MQRLRILSVAGAAYVAEAYLETAKAAEALGFSVSHVGAATDLWYGGVAEHVYQAGHAQAHLTPRPSGARMAWWRAPSAGPELLAALPAIADFYHGIIHDFRPHVCLIADDQGPLEVHIIRKMNENRIPVLLLEHGFGHAFAPRVPRLARAEAAARRLRAAAASQWRGRRSLISGGRPLPRLPTVRSFGRNGVCTICAYSGFTADELIRRGLPRRSLRQTGFPYYDQVVRLREQSIPRGSLPGAHRRRLLLLSSGASRFGSPQSIVEEWSTLLKISEIAAHSYDVTLRLHPGETLSLLPEGIRSKLLTIAASIDHAAEPVRLVLRDYSLIVGEASSVHQEAAILGVPAVALARPRRPSGTQRLSLAEFLEERLGMLVLRDGDDVPATLAAASLPEYRQAFEQALVGTGRLVYDNDGRAGRRVAETILLQCGLEQRTSPA